MLAAIGFKRSTNIYIAGAEIYGGKDRMAAISRLYPTLVTKETLLSPSELEPFRNFSSQVNFHEISLFFEQINFREISHVISSCMI